MKEELGPDHFEGRFWPGCHQHGFLALVQERMKRARPEPGKKGIPSR